MAKTTSIMTRIDPVIKEQAEFVLSQLGITMSAAMEIYLRQIALQRKIPFEMKLPDAKPIALGALSDEEFDALMNKAVAAYSSGQCVPIDQFETLIMKEIKS